MDAALVTDLVNVRYLSGFTGSNAALLVTVDGRVVFATDGRYVDQAATQCPDVERLVSRQLTEVLVATLEDHKPLRFAVETHSLSVDEHGIVAAQVTSRDGWELSSLEQAVERLREVKDADEIEALRTACDMSTQALAGLLAGELLGRTERALARDLEWRMYELGAEAIAFETIVASGPNSAIPHHEPTDRQVAVGDLLKIDFGARHAGYHADCTRTVLVGSGADWQRDIYAAVAAAQRAGVDACVVDTPVADVDAASRDSLASAGYLEWFTTGLGHGVGLQIHEEPLISKRHPGRLRAHTPLTIEPGIYLPGRGGVRIEDTVVVTATGPEVLTHATRDLLVLD